MQLLVGLQSSAEVTYNMGHWVVEYMGVSGSAFLAFFLIIKPWLEQQDVASRINKRSSHLSTEADQLAFAGFDIGASSLDTRVQEILATRQRQPGTQRLKTGLSEAVLAMEAQLASLEASISHEREFSVHQQELVMRVCLSLHLLTLYFVAKVAIPFGVLFILPFQVNQKKPWN
jgi:hypothetical protein